MTVTEEKPVAPDIASNDSGNDSDEEMAAATTSESDCEPIFEASCRLNARKFLVDKLSMTKEDAKAFVKQSVTWHVEFVNFECDIDDGTRTARLTADFNFGKGPIHMNLDYHFRARASFTEFHCDLIWDFGTILKNHTFKLKGTHLKASLQLFPDGWAPDQAMEFMYICMGIEKHCTEAHVGILVGSVAGSTRMLCQKLRPKDNRARIPAKKKAPATAAKGGVAKAKAASNAMPVAAAVLGDAEYQP